MTRRLPTAQTVAIVGATGAVGTEMLKCLEGRNYPVKTLRLFASGRSAGKTLNFKGAPITVEELSPGCMKGVDLALFASSAAISKDYGPEAARAGAIVVDNSSAFRLSADVPLVVPEVNAAALAKHDGIVANPNCTAALMVMALAPLHKLSPLVRVVASTYQAASGAGAEAMQELEDATRAHLNGQTYEPKVLPHPYAFNLFSHNDTMNVDTGYNGEESKVMAEARKIMGLPALRIGITCVRVPVMRAHAISISSEFETAISVDAARKAIEGFPGLKLVDDRARNYFPMPVDASGKDEVLVGRIRPDTVDPTGKTLALFLSGDQLLKGAALNAVQIAERLTHG
jgi:aspartate-semialdehyde dehydrogenase